MGNIGSTLEPDFGEHPETTFVDEDMLLGYKGGDTSVLAVCGGHIVLMEQRHGELVISMASYGIGVKTLNDEHLVDFNVVDNVRIVFDITFSVAH